MKTVAVQTHAQVRHPFSCGTKPGFAEVSWSAPTVIVWPAFDNAGPRNLETFPSLEDFNCHGFLCACPKRQEMQGGWLFCNLINFFGRNAALQRQNMTAKGKCQRRSLSDDHSSSRGNNLTGFLTDCNSSSDRWLAATLISRTVIWVIWIAEGFLWCNNLFTTQFNNPNAQVIIIIQKDFCNLCKNRMTFFGVEQCLAQVENGFCKFLHLWRWLDWIRVEFLILIMRERGAMTMTINWINTSANQFCP